MVVWRLPIAVAHNIGHALGSLVSIPHGRAVSVALAQTMDWTIEGNREAFDRVGVLLGGTGAGDVEQALHDIAAQFGEALALNGEEKANLSEQALADDMLAAANIAMLDATARDVSREDVEQLAAKMLAA